MNREEMNRIKEERGYSFKQLAEYSGVPVVTLQKIFSGATANPRKATLDAIERVLVSEENVYQGKAFQYYKEATPNVMAIAEEAAKYLRKEQGNYTIEDYRAIPDQYRVELIDGVIYEMTAPRTVHQDIAAIVHMAFYEHIRKNKKPCKVFEAPTDVQISCDNKTMVQPDVLVVCDRSKIRGFGIYGAPDFILEILSKSTRKKDMTVKLGKYQEAGVREYWIIDPYKSILIVYDLEDEDYIPAVYPVEGKVPVRITGGELEIDLDLVAESIRELGSLE
ncbi:MAG: Uma2 family endonuclease, partial [Lachnospiraceae bacterium]|nr:Uma2 family endonuclease [Lachnospiraceae bacterium]